MVENTGFAIVRNLICARVRVISHRSSSRESAQVQGVLGASLQEIPILARALLFSLDKSFGKFMSPSSESHPTKTVASRVDAAWAAGNVKVVSEDGGGTLKELVELRRR